MSAALPSPSSLRDATSPKVRGLGSPPSFRFILYALLPQGEPSGAALRLHAFAKGSHFGGAGAKRLRGRGCGQEAAHLVWHCLAEAQSYRKHDLNRGEVSPQAGLPSPSSLRDATSPKVRGFGYTGKFAFSKKLSLWESWREAPERARPLTARLHLPPILPLSQKNIKILLTSGN